MKRWALLLMTLSSPWLRFRFNQWSSKTEFGVITYWRWYTNEDVRNVKAVLWGALEDYREQVHIVTSLHNSSSCSEARMKMARQDLDEAACRYRALLRLARYFRAESFVDFPEVQKSGQVLHALRHRPFLPMGFAD